MTRKTQWAFNLLEPEAHLVDPDTLGGYTGGWNRPQLARCGRRVGGSWHAVSAQYGSPVPLCAVCEQAMPVAAQ